MVQQLCFIFTLLFTLSSIADDKKPHSYLWQTPSLQHQAQLIDSITERRVQQLMPDLMTRTGIDMWVLISREYNEDPVLKTFLPATWLSARRRTILVFVNTKEHGIKALAVAPYKVGGIFEKSWDKSAQPNQWLALKTLIDQYQPKTIGINESEHWAHADGLVVTDKAGLMAHLPQAYKSRVVSAEKLAVGWLETRIDEEIILYKELVALAHQIIARGFSDDVVEVDKTTTDDLVWWFRQAVEELHLDTWFHPSVSIQRSDNEKFDHEDSFTNGYGNQVIRAGDLLHVDFGISYLRLNTDTQQHAYVLKKGETQAPKFLTDALASGNKLQDIFTEEFAIGKTGNAVLASSRQKAIEAGLKPTIYTHPLGYHGHGAGTTLGMWDAQQGVEGSGDYPLHLNTAYSIELNNAVYIKEWGKEIRIMLEEDAFFDQSGVWYLAGRQEKLLVIKGQ